MGLGLSVATRLRHPLSYGSGASFSPADLTPLFWLDASQLALANDDPVAEFTDYSGNARHFVQTTAGNKPLFKAAGINGIGAVEGDGTDDSMTLAAFGAQTSWWGFIVFQPVAVASGKSLWSICDYPDTAVNYKILETNGAATINFNMSPGGLAQSISLANGTACAILLVGASTTLRGAADSGEDSTLTIVTGTPGVQPDAGGRADHLMRLFARGDGQAFNVRIGEVVFASGSLSSEDETSLWAYASEKWGTLIP